jgi:predicted kinase
MKLIITKGLPGAGKSTWAKAWAKEKPQERIRISRDDIRNMFGEYWVPQREGVVTEAEWTMVQAALSRGYDVCVDATNFHSKTDKSVEMVCGLVFQATGERVEVEIKEFDTPLEECIRRDAARPVGGGFVGEKVIRDFHEKYCIKNENTVSAG